MSHAEYWPYGTLQQPADPFNSGSFSASSITEDASGDFFTLSAVGGISYVFGTQNGFFAVDTPSGAILGLPKAAAKSFDPTVAG